MPRHHQLFHRVTDTGQTNSSLEFFPTTHTSTLQAIHLSMPSSTKPYAIAPTPLD